MSTPHTTSGPGREDDWYELRIQGHLDQRWTSWFDGLAFTHDAEGTTLLRGRVADQAALHGLLAKIRDMGLPLISVTRACPPACTATEATSPSSAPSSAPSDTQHAPHKEPGT